jgi:hypothetical protein
MGRTEKSGEPFYVGLDFLIAKMRSDVGDADFIIPESQMDILVKYGISTRINEQIDQIENLFFLYLMNKKIDLKRTNMWMAYGTAFTAHLSKHADLERAIAKADSENVLGVEVRALAYAYAWEAFMSKYEHGS